MSMTFEDCAKVREGFPKPFPDTPSNVVEQLRLNGKVVVITGAADGIGLAVATAMAEAGGNVALWYNSYVPAGPRCNASTLTSAETPPPSTGPRTW